MRRFTLLIVLLSTLWLDVARGDELLARIDIDRMGPAGLADIRATPQVAWWVELDDTLLIRASSAALAQLEARYLVEVLDLDPEAEPLAFVRGANQTSLEDLGFPVLAQGGRWAVVQALGMSASEIGELPEQPSARAHSEAELRPFEPFTTLVRQAANSKPATATRGTLNLQPILAAIDADRWFADLTTLAGWNRYTHGSGIADAQAFLESSFSALGLTVSSPAFSVQGTTAHNVIGKLTGSTRPDDWYIVGAHYDSTSENPASAAPGAEDNASGCAAVIEMARIFTSFPPEATILFMCYSGEEQGLFGSFDHIAELQASGEAAKVQAVLTMDMIGYDGDATLDCLLESSGAFESLLSDLANAASAHTELEISTSTFPFGSDHVPYINEGVPAVLAIENDWDSYPNYHRSSDLPTEINPEMGYQIIRMMVAALAEMAGAETVQSYWLDTVVHGEGQFNSQWRTDVSVRNMTSTPADIEILLYSDGEVLSLANTIEAGAQGTFEDIVALMAGDGIGILEVRSTRRLIVSGRTYNQTAEGTFGQFVDAYLLEDALGSGESAWLLQLRQDEGRYRTNLSFANISESSANLRVRLYDAAGTLAKQYPVALDAHTMRQDLSPFSRRADRPDLGWGFAEVSVLWGSGVLVSASVVDSLTNDATTIPFKKGED